jgi:hypothetical protein
MHSASIVNHIHQVFLGKDAPHLRDEIGAVARPPLRMYQRHQAENVAYSALTDGVLKCPNVIAIKIEAELNPRLLTNLGALRDSRGGCVEKSD